MPRVGVEGDKKDREGLKNPTCALTNYQYNTMLTHTQIRVWVIMG